jgi:hypothetical protein
MDDGRGKSGVVFIASGHHPFHDTVDVDGDGRDELIFRGVSNRLGWHFGIAAVRVAEQSMRPYNTAATPDLTDQASSALALVWYVLAGDGYDAATDISIDRRKRRIEIAFGNGKRTVLGFDGQPEGLPREVARERSIARDASYAWLRDAIRQSDSGYVEESLELIDRAIRDADRAHDAALSALTRRVSSRILIRGGRLAEAEERTRELMRTIGSRSDACWDAAFTLHLEGHIDRARAWYETGLSMVGEPARGRMTYEFLEGILFTEAERGRWDEARRAFDTFRTALFDTLVHVDYYADWLEWRRTGRLRRAVHAEQWNLDVFRYLALEYAWQEKTVAPRALIAQIDASTASGAYGPLGRSLKAEIIATAQNDPARALDTARDAYDEMRVLLRTDTAARVHFDIPARRYARLLEAAGDDSEARRIRESVRTLLAPAGG